MYHVDFKQSVTKDLKKLERRFRNKILAKIQKLAVNPYKENIKKLSLSQVFFRLRVGDYRVVFQIDHENRLIIIYYIRHRKDAYKHL